MADLVDHGRIAAVTERVAPTESTTWVRYTFAYGSQPLRLADGQHVTRPLARTVVQRDGTDGATTTLATTMESAAIQGVQPLDPASVEALDIGPRESTQWVRLQALPDDATTSPPAPPSEPGGGRRRVG